MWHSHWSKRRFSFLRSSFVKFELSLMNSKHFVSLIVVEQWLCLQRGMRHWHLHQNKGISNSKFVEKQIYTKTTLFCSKFCSEFLNFVASLLFPTWHKNTGGRMHFKEIMEINGSINTNIAICFRQMLSRFL